MRLGGDWHVDVFDKGPNGSEHVGNVLNDLAGKRYNSFF